MSTRPPNIVLVLCHDLGQRLGCYGVRNLKTPVLDALAAESVVLENYFATSPLCSPSRGSIMTGLYPHTHGLMGLVHRGWDLRENCVTLAQLLRGNGYAAELFGGRCCSDATTHRAVLFGLQHESGQSTRLGYQQHFHPTRPHYCDEVSAEFDAWLRARDKSESPFFACLGFFEAHREFKSPRYTPDDPATVDVPPYLPDAPEVREDLADLHGMIKAVDVVMETILATLKETGNANNTLLIFSTDHGVAFPRAKTTLYDPGIETACLLRWPDGFPGGKRYSQLLSNVDLLPTMLSCVGLPAPKHVQGRSFLPLLRGEAYETRTEIFAEQSWHSTYDPIRAIRTGKFKFIRNFPDRDGAPPARRPQLQLPTDIEASLSRKALAALGDPHLAPRAEEELYDLAADPNETNNVAAVPAYSATLAELRSQLVHWMEETADPLLQGPVPCPKPELQNR